MQWDSSGLEVMCLSAGVPAGRAKVPPPRRRRHRDERSVGFGCWGGLCWASTMEPMGAVGTPRLPAARAEPALPTLPGYVPACDIERSPVKPEASIVFSSRAQNGKGAFK